MPIHIRGEASFSDEADDLHQEIVWFIVGHFLTSFQRCKDAKNVKMSCL